ncbi:hypothetical protein A5692_02895 [Mycobacterium sp. E342]|uniref:TetR/AcrR family transcriptional regulator n=1 Tax=Mycobacterium sp. E342 TaxID=1834147 RepID=UPI0007FBD24C|nr:TetR/AcrR family transcriptional regulator [Mycobacterium sp. E342]OBH25047.1 hypothetical protein A5692_02895 [Mycobacterium sp. E342]
MSVRLRRREQFIDAAMTVFARAGVDRASVKDIAEQASVTPGLLYHYFDSKEALVAAVLKERGFMSELGVLLEAGTDQSAFTLLPTLVRAFDEALAAHGDLVSIFFSASQANAALRDFVATGESMLASYLESRATSDGLRPEMIGVAASSLFAAVAMGHKTGRRIDTDSVAELVLNGLTVSKKG